MNGPDYHIFTLENGLRCVHELTDCNAGYCGVVVNAGSRDDEPNHDGQAHFVEHTIFKGTKHRRSWHISNRMESVGGELNAYTTKEQTVVYANAPSGFTERSVELLSDLISNSVFPPKEVDREREVVIDEINSYLDSPADSVYDEFEELIYGNSRMSHNILGNSDSVRSLAGNDCRRFIDTHYTPGNMALYCSDNTEHRVFERIVAKHFGNLHFSTSDPHRTPPPAPQHFDEVRNRDGHQAHTIVGARTFGYNDERRFALFLLNNYLGGPCMNSRLNQELREKRGYVYTVDSGVGLMSDCGTMQIYFGCDRNHVDPCIRIIRRELETLASSAVNASRFDKIRTQYIGQLKVSADHRESRSASLGKSLLCYNEIHDADTTIERLRCVKAEELREIATLILDNGLNRLTLI